MNPFDSIRGVWRSGLLASAVPIGAVAVILGGDLDPDPSIRPRGAHVVAAIVWIGLLHDFVRPLHDPAPGWETGQRLPWLALWCERGACSAIG